MTNRRTLDAVLATLGVLVLFGLPVPAQDNSSPPMTVSGPSGFATSEPLRELAKLPKPIYEFHEPKPDLYANFHPASNPGFVSDPVEQSTPGGPASISVGLNLFGVGNGFGSYTDTTAPPDTNAAVGDAQVVEWVRESYAVFDKNTGAVIAGPIPESTLWAPLGQPCANAFSDPIVQWDRTAHRWLLAQNVYSFPYAACSAVSMTNDATGPYFLYSYSPVYQFPDYPKWGIFPSGYFETINNYEIIQGRFVFENAEVCAYNSVKLLVGDRSAEKICFQLTHQDYSLLPADQDSNLPPPNGQDEFFIGSYDVDSSNNHLYLYSMHPDFSNPSQSTFTGNGLADPFTVPTYSPYNPSCDPINGPCIPEPSGSGVASIADRLMYRFAYWNDGPLPHVSSTPPRPAPAQHWLVTHTTTASGGQAAMRWYEITAPIRTVTINGLSLFQSGTFAPDSNYRWMGSIARDKVGDIALGYSVSSSTMNPAIAFTGRTINDPLGQMEAEQVIVQGAGEQVDTGNRWGDYSSMSIDGSDGCTFWYAQEYYTETASFDWSTRLASLKFSNCH